MFGAVAASIIMAPMHPPQKLDWSDWEQPEAREYDVDMIVFDKAQDDSVRRFAPWVRTIHRQWNTSVSDHVLVLPKGCYLWTPIWPSDFYASRGQPMCQARWKVGSESWRWERIPIPTQIYALTRALMERYPSLDVYSVLKQALQDKWVFERPQRLEYLHTYSNERLMLSPPAKTVPGLTLVIAAHPDDEIIFGGVDLIASERVHIIFMTFYSDHNRRAEGNRLARALNATVTWNDLPSARWYTWKSSEIERANLEVPEGTTRIVSHSENGEYWRNHHIQCHELAKDLAAKHSLPFHTFYDRWRELTPEEEVERDRLLNVYQSQGITHWTRFWERYLQAHPKA